MDSLQVLVATLYVGMFEGDFVSGPLFNTSIAVLMDHEHQQCLLMKCFMMIYISSFLYAMNEPLVKINL